MQVRSTIKWLGMDYDLERKLPDLPLRLKREILEYGSLMTIHAETEILRQGQYVKVIPIVLEGLVKVIGSYGEKELLLYYIEPAESCIMSFSAGLGNLPSKVRAIAIEESELLLIPVKLLQDWVRKYPSFNQLFYKQFNKRYDDLLETIYQVLFEKMDRRILDYLKHKSQALGEKRLNLRHHQIAQDLGTAREVVSRVMKKLELDLKILQEDQLIEIL